MWMRWSCIILAYIIDAAKQNSFMVWHCQTMKLEGYRCLLEGYRSSVLYVRDLLEGYTDRYTAGEGDQVSAQASHFSYISHTCFNKQ